LKVAAESLTLAVLWAVELKAAAAMVTMMVAEIVSTKGAAPWAERSVVASTAMVAAKAVVRRATERRIVVLHTRPGGARHSEGPQTHSPPRPLVRRSILRCCPRCGSWRW
jgi:hypothetical protein